MGIFEGLRRRDIRDAEWCEADWFGPKPGAEPLSLAAVVGSEERAEWLFKLHDQGEIDLNDTIICPSLTGGLKNPPDTSEVEAFMERVMDTVRPSAE